MSSQYDDYLEEQQRKEEQLLELPNMLLDTVEQTHEKLESLNEQLDKTLSLSKGIDSEIKNSNTLVAKFKDYSIGGLIGAIIGSVLTLIIGG